jgi:ferric-dicitrate binding protein FerR (iron transport regulator)
MGNLYGILSKYFLGEASCDEDVIVNEFKKENLAEYKALKDLWARGEVEIKEFDTKRPWRQVLNQIKPESVKKNVKVRLYSQILRVAAVAAILIVCSFAGYFVWDRIDASQIIVVQNFNSQKIKEVILNDGTKVWLNKNSSIKYPKRFLKKKRNIELQGEGFFEVAKNPERLFCVKTSNSFITVLGTSFNIKSNIEKTFAMVTTGKVQVCNLNKTEVEILTPGMSAYNDGKKVEAFQTKNRNYSSWKTGKFNFENNSFKKVVHDFNTFYNKPIKIGRNISDQYQLTFQVDNVGIQEVLDILSLTCNVEVEDKGTYYLIKSQAGFLSK